MIKKKITLNILAGWWTILFAIAAMQVYFMTKSTVYFLVALLFIFLPLLVLKILSSNKKFSNVLIIIIGVIHFIPLLLQFAQIIYPGWDNVITAAVGGIILLSFDE